jgi:hypothetical protein
MISWNYPPIEFLTQAPGHTIEGVHDKVIVGFVQFIGGQVRWPQLLILLEGYVCKIIHPWDSFDYGFVL